MIEEKLGLESYFEKDRFGQREDGFYCLKAPTKDEKLSCMPSFKGVTGLGKKKMSEETNKKLRDFYSDFDQKFVNFYRTKFSWMS